MTPPRSRLTAPVLVAMLTLAACTTSASQPRIPDPPATTTPSPTVEPTPTPTASPTPSPSPAPALTPTPSPTPDAAQEIAALWQDFTETHLSRHENPDVEVDLQPWLSSDVVPSRTIGLDLPTYEFPNSPRPTGEVQTYPRVTVDGTTAELTDCMIYRVAGEGPDGIKTDSDKSRNWDATLKRNPQRGWIITAISTAEKTDTNCVPPQLRRQVLEAYDDYFQAEEQWWNPPDPNHPALPEYVSDTHLTRLRDEIMPPQIEAGAVLRGGGHDTKNAVVTDIGLGKASVEECTRNDPNEGLFVEETGERVAPPIDDDPKTHRVYAANLVQADDGRWLIDGTGGWVNLECEIGEPL